LHEALKCNKRLLGADHIQVQELNLLSITSMCFSFVVAF
jgi:hypothetical protein